MRSAAELLARVLLPNPVWYAPAHHVGCRQTQPYFSHSNGICPSCGISGLKQEPLDIIQTCVDLTQEVYDLRSRLRQMEGIEEDEMQDVPTGDSG